MRTTTLTRTRISNDAYLNMIYRLTHQVAECNDILADPNIDYFMPSFLVWLSLIGFSMVSFPKQGAFLEVIRLYPFCFFLALHAFSF